MVLKFSNTPRQMLFVFNTELQRFQPIKAAGLYRMPQNQVCYLHLHRRQLSGNRITQIFLGTFNRFSKTQKADSNDSKFLQLAGNNPLFVFAGTQTYDSVSKEWKNEQEEYAISLSRQHDDGSLYGIGQYHEERFSSATPSIIPTPSATQLEALLLCIHNTQESIEIDVFFRTDAYFEGRSDARRASIYQTFKDTNNPILRDRMRRLVEIQQNTKQHEKFETELTKLSSNLDQWQNQVKKEKSVAFNKQILSGFIAALGIVAVAVALIASAPGLNAMGVATVVVGIAAAITGGIFFFKNKHIQPTSLSSYLENHPSM